MKTFSCIYGESFNFSIALQLDKYYRNILTHFINLIFSMMHANMEMFSVRVCENFFCF